MIIFVRLDIRRKKIGKMELIRRQNLKRAIISHIIQTIKGELLDWDNLENWIDFKFENDVERDIAADMFLAEANRLLKRIV